MSIRAATMTRRRNPCDRMRANWRPITMHGLFVQQVNEDNCGPACAEMLLADRGVLVSQVEIAQGLVVPVNAQNLAQRMSELAALDWSGVTFQKEADFSLGKKSW